MSNPASAEETGRPRGEGEAVSTHLDRTTLEALDAFAADQGEPTPSRPEAVRIILAGHLEAKGYLRDGAAEAASQALQAAMTADRYADADPGEGVMVTGVGPMTLRRAVRKHTDWRENHGLGLVSIYRGADKDPGMFDVADLGRLAGLERFR